MSTKKRDAYRDAGTGQFIKKSVADTKPKNTWVKEKVPVAKPKK